MSLAHGDQTMWKMAWLAVPSLGSGATPKMSSRRAYAEAPDPELLLWSAGGDTHAFDEIVTRHGPFALRVAKRLIPNADAAEDVVQEAMVRAWSQAGRFDPQRARLTTWLYRIVVNLCIDHQRRRQMQPLPEGFDPADGAAGMDEAMQAEECRSAVADAVNDLPPPQRAAMVLVYDEDMSGADAARVLGLSAKAVERLLSRARAFLRGRLSPEDYGKGF